MKKAIVICLALFMVVSLGGVASAKTLKLAMDADPVSLDPHVQLSGGMLQYSHMVFDPLVRWNKAGGFDARLATKWERTDDLTMRFYLRKGVKFHSGNAFTAKDVKWTCGAAEKKSGFQGAFRAFCRRDRGR